MKELSRGFFSGERALFRSTDLRVSDSVFDDGESPLKECSNIKLGSCLFRWKYPLWHCIGVSASDCAFFVNSRAGIWYSEDISFENCAVESPKNFRRCSGVSLKNVSFSDAAETLWNCRKVSLENVTAKGDYFGMNCSDITADGLTLFGNYCFDGCRNVTVKNSRLLSKDAFWNCENVTLTDSFVSGEYFGWNSKNITLINCTVESLQGFCRMENLTMKNCRLINTELAFEYSTVNAEITGDIKSIKNPAGGMISADSIGETILESGIVDTSRTEVICRGSERQP